MFYKTVRTWGVCTCAVLALLLGHVSGALAAQILYGYGQPLGGGIVSAYIVDMTPGPPQAAGSPTIQQDGNVINIYYQLPYTSGSPTSTTLFTQFGPLAEGDYQINLYAAMYLVGTFVPGYSLRGTFQLTALSGATLRQTFEYYYAARNHYFITGDPNEIAALDSGHFPGWVRTGNWSWSFAPLQTIPSTLAPVCRFYGLPSAGLDSHFFTTSAMECQYVQDHWSYAWQLESQNVFEVIPFSGFCPPSTFSVFRLYNNQPDVNHRYTTDPIVKDMMVAQGWIFEGVAWCSPYLAP